MQVIILHFRRTKVLSEIFINLLAFICFIDNRPGKGLHIINAVIPVLRAPTVGEGGNPI